MKLDQLQNDFIASIFNEDRETALTYVHDDDRLTASERLGIYRGSVHGILTQALGDTFLVVKALLGEEFFDKMCDRFIDQYPPSTPFFSDFGSDLSHFLSEFEPLKTIPFISDMAEFEWSRHKLWQQTPSQPFDFSQIATLTEEEQTQVVFHLSRSLHLFQSNYRIDLIWFAHQDNSDIKLEEIDVNSEINLLVWKRDNSIKIANYNASDLINVDDTDNQTSNKEYWNFLKAIENKLNITELAIEFEEKFPVLLNQSIQDGWIESFTYNQNNVQSLN